MATNTICPCTPTFGSHEWLRNIITASNSASPTGARNRSSVTWSSASPTAPPYAAIPARSSSRPPLTETTSPRRIGAAANSPRPPIALGRMSVLGERYEASNIGLTYALDGPPPPNDPAQQPGPPRETYTARRRVRPRPAAATGSARPTLLAEKTSPTAAGTAASDPHRPSRAVLPEPSLVLLPVRASSPRSGRSSPPRRGRQCIRTPRWHRPHPSPRYRPSYLGSGGRSQTPSGPARSATPRSR